MVFFPQTFYDSSSSPASFNPLFRLLDDFDNYSRQGSDAQQHACRRSRSSVWQPKFDVREAENCYELHGELPGMSKDNVHIEFTEPQTLVVRGRTERSYSSNTPPAGLISGSENSGAITNDANSHKASVEDDNENNADQASADATKKVQKSEKKASGGVKYWLSERSVGEFSRTFNFPAPVDQDAVSASFKDGILSVVVPKAIKHGARRIAIN
ncbi:hypothetical protein QQS21_009497 [Conoideocrella luteorostrata]|uniref:SHSP domain-containing protein n=1 Tax=Conoideocrella luteorostrata TaxID=1105319 RepID=A0AAJ0CGS4_9HYPO|nr:hypothetical protein QQS21_009497 [Conoideocrella luteorostrata]